MSSGNPFPTAHWLVVQTHQLFNFWPWSQQQGSVVTKCDYNQATNCIVIWKMQPTSYVTNNYELIHYLILWRPTIHTIIWLKPDFLIWYLVVDIWRFFQRTKKTFVMLTQNLICLRLVLVQTVKAYPNFLKATQTSSQSNLCLLQGCYLLRIMWDLCCEKIYHSAIEFTTACPVKPIEVRCCPLLVKRIWRAVT